jgi:hypothetical protein
MDIHTAEPLVPEPSFAKVEIVIEKLKRYKSLGTDQILAELIKAGGEILCSEIHRFIINSVWNKEELPQQWKECIILPIHKKGDKTDCNNYQGLSLLLIAYKILSNILLTWLTLYVKLLGIISVGSIIIGALVIRLSTFATREKMGV